MNANSNYDKEMADMLDRLIKHVRCKRDSFDSNSEQRKYYRSLAKSLDEIKHEAEKKGMI